MNTSIRQQEKTFNWNSDVRLLERAVEYLQPAIALNKNKTNSNAF
jgi:hypothetical protein